MPRIIEHSKDLSDFPYATVLIYRVDLQCQHGGSDKVYIVEVFEKNVKQSTNTIVSTLQYVVVAYYGKRGSHLQWKEYGTYPNMQTAIGTAERKVRDKERGKGSSMYIRVNTEDYRLNPKPISFGLSQSQQPSAQQRKTLNVSKYMIPSKIKYTDGQIVAYLNHNDYILEKVPALVFKWFHLQPDGFDVYNVSGNYIDTVSFPSSLKVVQEELRRYNGAIFLVIDASSALGKRYEIMDVCFIPWHTKDVRLYMWKERRAMMTILLTDLFGGADMYYPPQDCDFRILDYAYENKQEVYDYATNEVVIVKHINHEYEDALWLAQTK